MTHPPAADDHAKPGAGTGSVTAAIAGSALFAGVLVGALVYFGVDDEVMHLLEWVKGKGGWAPFMCIVIMACVVIFLIPGVLFTTGAGFVFGVVEGSVYVLLGTTLGASIAFLIARHLFGRRAADFVRKRARLSAVSDELAPHGWKIVLLSRLIPLFPSKLANYLFGLTRFSFGGFVGGSLLGFLPFTVHNVYLGSLAANVATAGARNEKWTPLQWGLYGSGFVATVILVIYLARLARRALARYTEDRECGG